MRRGRCFMKSVLVIGMGKFGRHFAKKMIDLGNEVMIVDKDEAVVERHSATFSDAQIADCTNKDVLLTLGVHHFDICLVAIGKDFQSSMVVTALLRDLDAQYIVSKAESGIQADLLTKIGADEIVYPEKEMAEKIAVRFTATNVFDYIDLTEDYAIYEVPVLYTWIGKTISEINIRRKYKTCPALLWHLFQSSDSSQGVLYPMNLFGDICHLYVTAWFQG